MKIQRGNITIQIDQTTSRYGDNRAVAYIDGRQVAVGGVPGIPSRAYSRIEFNMKPPAELYKQADSKGRFVDTDYEEPEESFNARPIDTCTFNLTDDEARQITEWRTPAPQTATQPTRPVTSQQEFGIGRIGDADMAMEAIANLDAAAINQRNALRRETKLCDCGHYSAWPMSTSSGSSCPDCYDRMSL